MKPTSNKLFLFEMSNSFLDAVRREMSWMHILLLKESAAQFEQSAKLKEGINHYLASTGVEVIS